VRLSSLGKRGFKDSGAQMTSVAAVFLVLLKMYVFIDFGGMCYFFGAVSVNCCGDSYII
jgi:hypothetical protein